MAARSKKVSVAITPGQNQAVPHVFALEDLLRRMHGGAAKTQRGRGLAPGGAGQLAVNLEASLRELRATAAQPAPAPRRGGKKT